LMCSQSHLFLAFRVKSWNEKQILL